MIFLSAFSQTCDVPFLPQVLFSIALVIFIEIPQQGVYMNKWVVQNRVQADTYTKETFYTEWS